MKDELVSFETSKLAKEKGFNEECGYWWGEDKRIANLPYCGGNGTGLAIKEISTDSLFGMDDAVAMAPTQSLLQRWLREVHNYHIRIDSPFDDVKWIPNVFETGRYSAASNSPNAYGYKTYEEALEAGLQEALKLIKI